MTVLEYHERTKHSVASIRANRHYLDWDNHPLPFKIYRGLESTALPRQIAPEEVAALAAVGGSAAPPSAPWAPDRKALARLLQSQAQINLSLRSVPRASPDPGMRSTR